MKVEYIKGRGNFRSRDVEEGLRKICILGHIILWSLAILPALLAIQSDSLSVNLFSACQSQHHKCNSAMEMPTTTIS